MSGRVRVRYCNAPARLRYSVASESKSPSVAFAVEVPAAVVGTTEDSAAAEEPGASGGAAVMSHRTSWETPRGRYDEHISKFSLSMKPRFNRPVGERNHF
jgi:hypothetical protein